MDRYNYYDAVFDDVKDFIENDIDLKDFDSREELEEYLNDTLWTVDGVTGNGSGSYTFNSYRAEEYLMHNLDLLAEAINEFGGNIDILKDGAEACDVTIRCYLLSGCIADVLDEMEDTLDEIYAED